MSDGLDPSTQKPEAGTSSAARGKNSILRAMADGGLEATPETAPIPTDSAKKDDAATKVLREGVLKTDQGAEEAIDALPDRTRDL